MQPRTLDNIGKPYDATFEKRETLLNKVYEMACNQGYDSLSRRQVAETTGCAETLINYYFGTVAKMRDKVMRMAVNKKNLEILSRGIAERNKIALEAPIALKKQAVALLYK